MSQAEQQFREAVYQHLKLLNARGPRTAPTLASESGAVLREMPSPSPAYLAGFIDGEGSLMINRVKAKGSWKTQYRARIAIGNTYRAVLEDVRRAYGGILVDDPRANPRWKHLYQLVWTGGMVEKLLQAVKPYLLIKREQASVMMDLVRHKQRTRQGRRGRNGRFFAALPDDVVAYRDGLCVRMKELNARGPPVLTPART